MNIKHNEVQINKENPFENCKLDRQKYSRVLTSIIESYDEGFVLAINNKWGTGKTTFIKMWKQELINSGYKTVYFNSWENDFENNPLTAIMGELKTLSQKKTEEKFKSVIQKAAVISKSIAPAIMQSVLNKYLDTDDLKNIINGATKGALELFENDVNEYSNKKKGISEFKNELKEFISNENGGKPVVFIVDELDRCRPNYAVSILEQIKHFFSIPNIIFVLSIDKIQLEHAIKGVYGSADIDSSEYLKRFIDVEYSIPEPESDVFYKYLYDYFKFDDFFKSDLRLRNGELNKDKESFLNICSILFSNKEITLRQQEKIFNHSRIALLSFNDNNYVIPKIFLFLIYLRVLHFEFYKRILKKDFTLKELQVEFFKIIKKHINELTKRELIWLEGFFINHYHNYLSNSYSRNKLYEYDMETNKYKSSIISVIDSSDEGQNDLMTCFGNLHRENSSRLSLEYFFNKIELLDNFK